MKCSTFIATSIDGYIATKNGGVEWLDTVGNTEMELGDEADMGFNQYIAKVDCMIMGRKTMEKLSSFELTEEQWPYGNLPIIVLSKHVKTPPENLQGKVEIYSGSIPTLLDELEEKGFRHAYVDGGSTITSFIKMRLINEMCITQAPVILGSGIRLFGELEKSVILEETQAKAYKNDFIQIQFSLKYED